MVDIAALSVVASTGLAGLTIVASVYTSAQQRKHEAALDFEGRVWERKSETLFKIIELAFKIIDTEEDVNDDNRTAYALNLSVVLDDLQDLAPAVQALASKDCRLHTFGLMQSMRLSGVSPGAGRSARRHLADYRNAQTAEDRVKARDRRHQAQQRAVANFQADMTGLRARAVDVVNAARESVQRPND